MCAMQCCESYSVLKKLKTFLKAYQYYFVFSLLFFALSCMTKLLVASFCLSISVAWHMKRYSVLRHYWVVLRVACRRALRSNCLLDFSLPNNSQRFHMLIGLTSRESWIKIIQRHVLGAFWLILSANSLRSSAFCLILLPSNFIFNDFSNALANSRRIVSGSSSLWFEPRTKTRKLHPRQDGNEKLVGERQERKTRVYSLKF